MKPMNKLRYLKFFIKEFNGRVILIYIILATIGIIYTNFFTKEVEVIPVIEREYFKITSEVIADAAIIFDIDSNEIISGKNINELHSIASITKLTSAFVFFEYLSQEDEVIISSEDLETNSITPLVIGARWSAIDLLKYSLIVSSNEGINAVARTIKEKTGKSPVSLINEFAQNNKLVQTHFINTSGLDTHESLSGSESSALDLAYLSKIFLETYPKLAKATLTEKEIFFSLDGKSYIAENTNKLLSTTTEKVLLTKTGYTDIAGGTLIMVTNKKGKRIAFVVLGSTRANRFVDMKRLFEIYDNLGIIQGDVNI